GALRAEDERRLLQVRGREPRADPRPRGRGDHRRGVEGARDRAPRRLGRGDLRALPLLDDQRGREDPRRGDRDARVRHRHRVDQRVRLPSAPRRPHVLRRHRGPEEDPRPGERVPGQARRRVEAVGAARAPGGRGKDLRVARQDQGLSGSIVMREAVIVSTARTPIGRAYRGAFNNLEAPSLAAHAIRAAVQRAKLDPAEVDDVVMGAAVQQGTQGYNVGRVCAIAAGLPVTVSGMSIDRQCASGLMAIATAAKQVIVDGMPIVVGGGLESISLVQNDHRNTFRTQDPGVMKVKPELYMAMLDTAEVVAKRYNVSREAQDQYGLE